MKYLKLCTLAMCLGAAQAGAQTPVNEVNTAALVGPFDQTAGHQTYLTAHAPNGISTTSIIQVPQVITHWTFWSEDCEHLANFNVCLTLDDSVVLDVSNMGAVGPQNEELDSRVDLTGFRGLYTVHAYETDERCRDPEDQGFILVNDAINGTWSIANLETNASFGDRAQGMNTDPSGLFIAVPDERFSAVDLPFFNPDSLEASTVFLVTLVENFGDLPGEIGPTQGRVVISTRASVCDNQEICISLPDVRIGCTLVTSLIPGPDALIPETVTPSSGGFLRLSTPRFVMEDPGIVGDQVWIYTYHGQQIGPFGTGSRGTYINPKNSVM